MSVRATRDLLDVAAEVLVADPSASLGEVAFAAGIGRTTLHKHYATREDLLLAVGHRVVDLYEQAVAGVSANDEDGGLHAMVEAMVPIGPQLAFVWRTPSLDHAADIVERWKASQAATLVVLERAQALGVIAAGVPDWWLLQTYYSLLYVASESVQSGHLAPRDAPNLVVRTFLHGIGTERQGNAP